MLIARNTSSTQLVVCVFVGLVAIQIPSSLSAQMLKPVTNSDSIETTNLEIQKIYNLTEVARTIQDFERIIKRSDKLLAQEVSGKDRKYLESLIAWSRNRIGQKHLKNIDAIQQMGLDGRPDVELLAAIQQFDTVIESSPLTWRAWLGRARIHMMQGESEAALGKFIEVTRLNRNCWDAWFNAAEICLDLKKFDEAIEFYSRVITENPTDVQSLTGRAHSHLAIDEFPAALSDYGMVVKLYPKDETAICNLGDALMRVEMWTEALEQYETAERLGNSSVGQERLANFLVTSGDKELRDPSRAITLSTKALEESPNNVVHLKTLAVAYAALGQTEKSEQIMAKLNKLSESSLREASQPRPAKK